MPYRAASDHALNAYFAPSAIIVGLVGALLAVLTVMGVFGGHLTAPASAG